MTTSISVLPGDISFCLVDNDVVGVICAFVPTSFFNLNQHLDDTVRDQIDGILPDGFYWLEESTCECDYDLEEGRAILLEAGFVENEALRTYLEN
jgi:hypothetical protein